jgi:hypothetical protein
MKNIEQVITEFETKYGIRHYSESYETCVNWFRKEGSKHQIRSIAHPSTVVEIILVNIPQQTRNLELDLELLQRVYYWFLSTDDIEE